MLFYLLLFGFAVILFHCYSASPILLLFGFAVIRFALFSFAVISRFAG